MGNGNGRELVAAFGSNDFPGLLEFLQSLADGGGSDATALTDLLHRSGLFDLVQSSTDALVGRGRRGWIRAGVAFLLDVQGQRFLGSVECHGYRIR